MIRTSVNPQFTACRPQRRQLDRILIGNQLARLFFAALMAAFLLFTGISAHAAEDRTLDLKEAFGEFKGCFVLYDQAKDQYLRYNPAACLTRYIPCSTYKVPHALIALDSGVVSNATEIFSWDGKEREIKSWNRDHDLISAIQNSVVWVFQEIAQRVGRERMADYLKRFDYGNQDCTGELTRFWLDGPLMISPDEQVAFMRKFAANTLPVKQEALDAVKMAMVYKKTNDYTLRGKTGSGRLDGKTWGWYVGYVTPEDRTPLFFATYIEGPGAWSAQALDITLKIFGVDEGNSLRINFD
ncbi:MAG: class D beta-lactamase [bacterium]|nr:class D beta-lactamase [bacterium]